MPWRVHGLQRVLVLTSYALQDTLQEYDTEVLYGEQTDYDGLTFLWRNQTNGLA